MKSQCSEFSFRQGQEVNRGETNKGGADGLSLHTQAFCQTWNTVALHRKWDDFCKKPLKKT